MKKYVWRTEHDYYVQFLCKALFGLRYKIIWVEPSLALNIFYLDGWMMGVKFKKRGFGEQLQGLEIYSSEVMGVERRGVRLRYAEWSEGAVFKEFSEIRPYKGPNSWHMTLHIHASDWMLLGAK